MADRRPSSASAASSEGPNLTRCLTSSSSTCSSSPTVFGGHGPARNTTLVEPSKKKQKKRQARFFRVFRSVFRSFPIISAPSKCSFGGPVLCMPEASRKPSHHLSSGSRVTGTLFGQRKSRVSLTIQEAPGCLPSVIIELGMQTQILLREMNSGMVRIALECDRHTGHEAGGGKGEHQQGRLMEELVWTLFCNGKRTGYGVRRELTEDDIAVMETLRTMSMGVGVLPASCKAGDSPAAAGEEAELMYMRANFEHVVGSRDSETLYMLSPDGNTGPDLTIFFIRV